MEETMSSRVKALSDKGVTIVNPPSVLIGPEVDLERISGKDVVIHPGTRIFGSRTIIMEGARLGQEGPVSIEDCQVGPRVELKGGFFRNSVFLKGANMGAGAHVRDACILEEEASCAHTVGLKHTILLPFVTLGSLVNFCDCLMAGGTSRKDHSEVGSSYIHFNYTPNQDKATPSLIGDVPAGVMLDRRPIFLGGQGGLVGPSVIGYGTVIAAGVIFQDDVPEGGKLITGVQRESSDKDFIPGLYLDIKRRTRNNVSYIANLIALKAWYRNVRCLFGMDENLLSGAEEKLDMVTDERIARLKALAEKMPHSIREYKSFAGAKASEFLVKQKEELFRNRSALEDAASSRRSHQGQDTERDAFLEALEKRQGMSGVDYVEAIQNLPRESRAKGTHWLQTIVDDVENVCLEVIPLFR